MPVLNQGSLILSGVTVLCSSQAAIPHLSGLTLATQGAGDNGCGFPSPSVLFQTKAPARTCGPRRDPWRVRR